MDIAQFSSLLESLYSAESDSNRWESVAQRIADAFGAESASLQIQELTSARRTTFVSITDNISSQAREDYEKYYFQRDVYVQHAIKYGLAGAYLSQEAVSPNDVARTEFYTDWGRKTGVFHVVGGGSMLSETTVALLAVHRDMAHTEFSEAERQCLNLLLPHAGRALQIAAQLGGVGATNAIRKAALERLDVGTVAVAGNGQILWLNSVAERLFREGDAVQAVSGRIRAVRNHDVLARMILECVSVVSPEAAPGGVMSLSRPARTPLSLLIGPAADGGSLLPWAQSAAVIFIHDPEIANKPDELALAELYGLTPAESRLAAAISKGERLQHYADRHSLRLATVKVQLRQVMVKTGTTRQSDLTSKLARNSILRMAPSIRNG